MEVFRHPHSLPEQDSGYCEKAPACQKAAEFWCFSKSLIPCRPRISATAGSPSLHPDGKTRCLHYRAAGFRGIVRHFFQRQHQYFQLGFPKRICQHFAAAVCSFRRNTGTCGNSHGIASGKGPGRSGCFLRDSGSLRSSVGKGISIVTAAEKKTKIVRYESFSVTQTRKSKRERKNFWI